jgi:hypothetical protein
MEPLQARHEDMLSARFIKSGMSFLLLRRKSSAFKDESL